jgi:hypothetical protein
MKKAVLIFLLLLTRTVYAQTSYRDVVYLKNGSIIRGIIMEQVPGKSIKIETGDKSLFVFQMEEIEQMVKEQINEEPAKGNQQATGEKKGYLAVLAGPSTPINDLASKDPENKGAGFAKSGAIFDLSFSYRFGKNFGMATSIRGQSYLVDAQAMADELVKSAPSGSLVSVESKAWSIGGFLLGGYGSFPISGRFSFDTKLMLGFLSATSPELTIKISGPFGSGTGTQKSASSATFAYMAGAGIRYDAGKSVCLLANLDYLGAKPEFTNVESTFSNAPPQKNTFSQQIGAINVGFGIGLRL